MPNAGTQRNQSDTFGSRMDSAASANAAALARFKARPAANDPEVIERLAKQKAVSDARDARQAERKAAREDEAVRVAAEQAAAAAELVLLARSRISGWRLRV